MCFILNCFFSLSVEFRETKVFAFADRTVRRLVVPRHHQGISPTSSSYPSLSVPPQTVQQNQLKVCIFCKPQVRQDLDTKAGWKNAYIFLE